MIIVTTHAICPWQGQTVIPEEETRGLLGCCLLKYRQYGVDKVVVIVLREIEA
jgi:hypothetical protein